MKKVCMGVVLLGLALAVRPADAAFVVGGENGWQFSTDGFLNVFGVYQTTQKKPDNVVGGGITGDDTTKEAQQHFSVRTGLLPVGIGLNVKAPTTKGVDYAVRLGIYPSIQNSGSGRTDIAPNIDFREINFTADGKFGQILAGRAIGLYQAKNILTDMTLFGAGVVGPVVNGPTMGHIGYGYLYPNFTAQFRYTTPDINGFKVALSVNDPYDIGAATVRNSPRIENEISYATTFNGGTFQAWVSGLYQTAAFSEASAVRPGGHATSLGGAGGAQVVMGGLECLLSGYGGQGLGMLAVQNGSGMDATGKERKTWGFLAQSTYKLTPELKAGLNYGRSNGIETNDDKSVRAATGVAQVKTQQAATGALTYNINKFTQVIAEYTFAQDKWFNNAKQNSNIIALGTFFYW